MEDVLDSVRRIVSRWVETLTPITQSVAVGDTILEVASTVRFQIGDEVMIESPLEGEIDLIIQDIVDETHIELTTAALNSWDIAEAPALRKLINGMFVEGIYIGDPQVIPMYPAIVVNATTIDSEWMTLDSTKETYNIEIAIHVEEATHEAGYRFLLRMLKVIREGLKRNIFPLVGDFNITSLGANIQQSDLVVKVADSSIFNTQLTDLTIPFPRISDARCIVEDRFKSEETRVKELLDETTIAFYSAFCQEFNVSDNTILINPQRFIYNSWPKSSSIGNSAKEGTLLQTAVISWFAEEEKVQNLKGNDPHLK